MLWTYKVRLERSFRRIDLMMVIGQTGLHDVDAQWLLTHVKIKQMLFVLDPRSALLHYLCSNLVRYHST